MQKFRTSLAVGGYQLSKERDVYAGEKEGIPRVMACAYSTDRFAVLLLQYIVIVEIFMLLVFT